MSLIIIIFIYLLKTFDLSAIDQINYMDKNDFNKLRIVNGTVKYFNFLRYPGYGIEFDYEKKQLNEEVDLFLDFNERDSKFDKTLHYTIKSYKVKIDPNKKFNNSSVGLFNNPVDKIIINVDKNRYLSNYIDLGSFYFDFFLSLTFYQINNTILKKGIYYDNKFYGIICRIEDKRIVIKLENFFYDNNKQTYTFNIKSNIKIELNKWYHIGFIFNRVNGKLLLYINGELDNEKFARAEQSIDSEILTPKFKENDGSDLMLFDNFFGYVDNFRIGKTHDVDFKQYYDSLFNKVIIESECIDLKFINSQISNIIFKIKNQDKGIIQIFYKYGNKLSDLDSMEWNEYKVLIQKNDNLLISDFLNTCRFYKWKIEMYRNLQDKDNPIFYGVEIKYKKNQPPLSPKDIQILKYDNIIELRWRKNLEDDIRGYIIYWGTKSKMYENKIDVGLKNNYIFNFLEGNQNYYFSVKSYNYKEPYNLSEFSKEVHIFNK